MGQRHQLFVIAKVKDRYRTLCAVHHQWLYGRTALRRCLGTLETFQDPTYVRSISILFQPNKKNAIFPGY